MQITHILVAVDRFPQDEDVLLRAHALAQEHDAALTIVHILDLPREVVLPAGFDTLEGQAELAVRDRINEVLHRHGINPADVAIRIESGSSALKLIEICDTLRPSFVA